MITTRSDTPTEHALLVVGLSLAAVPAAVMTIAAIANLAGYQRSGAFLIAGTAIVCVLSGLSLLRLGVSRVAAAAISFVPVAAILGLAALVSTITDLSYDSNSYHKIGVGALAQSWDPFEGSVAGWAARTQPTVGDAGVSIWVDHYPHGGWQFASGIVNLTGAFEAGKVLTLLTSLAVGLVAWWLFRARLGAPSRAAVAVLLGLNPIAAVQAFSFMIDGAVGNFVILATLLLLGYVDSEDAPVRPLILSGLAVSIVALANLKFTGLFFAGGSVLVVSGLLAFRAIRGREQWRPLWLLLATAGSAAVAATALVGGAPYLTNVVDHGSPFYPASANSTIDIIQGQRPPGFDRLSTPERYVISNLAASEDLQGKSNRGPHLKIPFTWEPAGGDLSQFRVAGYGQWFGGCLLLTIIALLYGAFRWRRLSPFWRSVLLVVAFTALFGFVSPESWWARFYPQLPLVVPLMAAFLSEARHRIASTVMLAAMAVNTFGLAATHVVNITADSAAFRSSVDAQICGRPVEVVALRQAGVLYSVIDRCGSAAILSAGTTPPNIRQVNYWVQVVPS